ncbi:hypothetical protein ACHAXT_009372 [Thalassiosira profunda]
MAAATVSTGGDGVDGQVAGTGHRTSSTAACGYVTFLLCNVLLVIYPLWALLPHRIIASIEEKYAIHYPPRELALYIPTYLALLFVFVPVLYMGLNMRSSPAADDIDGVWDARAHERNATIIKVHLAWGNPCPRYATPMFDR